jgi:hypothetical protein
MCFLGLGEGEGDGTGFFLAARATGDPNWDRMQRNASTAAIYEKA